MMAWLYFLRLVSSMIKKQLFYYKWKIYKKLLETIPYLIV